MSKRFEAEANRAVDGSQNTCQFCKRAEWGLDADGSQDALAACWTGLLSRVKKRSEAVRSECKKSAVSRYGRDHE